MKKHWSIQQKLITSFLAVAMFLVAIGAVNYHFIKKTLAPYDRIASTNVPNLTIFIDLMDAQKSVTIPLAALYGNTATPQQVEAAKKEVEAQIARFDEAAKRYEEVPFTDGEAEVWSAFKDKAWKPFSEAAREIVRLSSTGKPEDDKKRDELYDNGMTEIRKARVETFKNLVDFQLKATKLNTEEANKSNSELKGVMWTMIAVGFLLAFFLGYIISRQLSTVLKNMTDTLTGQSDTVSTVVTELASASQELSSASTEQAAALQETASAVEEISSMVNKAAENAKESSSASDGSKSKAEHGQEVIQQMVSSMGDINTSNETIMSEITASNQRIAEIVQVIQEIGNKTKVINDIVFQTKLLSFNASVEAARAGEHGKGFAVVAEEVGNLAQMSGNAAKEISTMLEDSVKKVDTIVGETKTTVDRLMSDAKNTVERGTQIAQECGEVLKEIVTNAGQVSQMVSGIADASNEQSRGVNEISKAIHELNQSTQMNASAANQCAASAEQLSVQAFSLKQAAEHLRVIVSGGTLNEAAAQHKPTATPPSATHKKDAPKKGASVTKLAKSKANTAAHQSEKLPDPAQFDEVG